jgi:hypothetical protein
MNQPNIKLEDDSATLPVVAKNGYYTVGDKNFNFKFNALMYASKTQQPVEWHFGGAQYAALDWQTALPMDIKSLYRLRAQQLRNQYNYLILCFSGGSDSTNILQSFIHNNIHLDEIICDWPLEHTSNWSVSNDPSPYNHISEWELAIRPMLNYVQTHHPEIKITITDTTEDLSIEDHEHALTISHMGPYQSTKRYQNVCQRYSEVYEKNSSAAIIMGCDKPCVFIDKNVFCVTLIDKHCFFKTSNVPVNRTVEYFYWASDMPEILRQQAHMIYQYLLAHPEAMSIFLPNTPLINQRQDLIKSIIYPDWNNAIFQADKASSFVYSEQHAWINHEPTRAIQAWHSNLNSHFNMVNDKYLSFFPGTRRVKNVQSFVTRPYAIGAFSRKFTHNLQSLEA